MKQRGGVVKAPKGITLAAKSPPGGTRVLTSDAITFIAELCRTFAPRREHLLARRQARQKAFDAGTRPDFDTATQAIRDGNWVITPLPRDLQDRRTELVGSTRRTSVITGLNADTKVFLADFEDTSAATWNIIIEGQQNLMDRWTSAMEWHDPASGKRYAMAGKPAVLMVRPRGLHLEEANMLVDGKPVPAAFFDFGLYAFHNAATAVSKTSGPYFHLAKLESREEARLWNDIFIFTQSRLGLPSGTIRATIAIETLGAVFAMDEIIFELRDHMAALALDRRDLTTSFIRTFAADKRALLPDFQRMAPDVGFIAATAALMIRTCHRRGCLAIDGTALDRPAAGEADSLAAASARVTLQAQADARAGFDGIMLAHPGLVGPAHSLFNELMPTPNQLYVTREDVTATQEDLLRVPPGTREVTDVEAYVRIGIGAIASLLAGHGITTVDGLAADVAAAELARAQLWQWLKFGASFAGREKMTPTVFNAGLKAGKAGGDGSTGKDHHLEAAALFKALVTAKSLTPLPASLAARARRTR